MRNLGVKPAWPSRLYPSSLTTGLALALPLNDGGSSPRASDVSGNDRHGTLAGTFSWDGIDNGIGLELSGSNGNITTPSPRNLGTDPATVTIRFRANSVANDQALFAMGGADENLLWIENAAAQVRTRGNLTNTDIFAGPIVAGTWYTITLVSPGGTTIDVYVDGEFIGQESTGGSYWTSLTDDWTFGERVSAGTWDFDGDFSHIYVHGRVLTADEVRFVFEHPFDMFTAPVVPAWAFADLAAPGGAAMIQYLLNQEAA